MWFWLAAAIWIALALPHLDTPYSIDWDSSQFARGARHFDIAQHQPHPPGYPLWILGLRALAPLTGVHPAQVILALLFTVAALFFFRKLAREMLGEAASWAATAILAFSPLVCLYAISPVNYAVDLFVSCSLGWMALRLWRGEARWAPAAMAVAAVMTGFRPSGVTFMAPLMALALGRAARVSWRYAVAGLAVGMALALAWFLPTAALSGGPGALLAMDRQQLMVSVRSTSVLFGAAPGVHAHMIVDACLYMALALVALAPPLMLRRTGGRWEIPESGCFLALWLIPNLAFVLLLHCGAPGYVLLSVPPLVILGVKLAQPALERTGWIAAAVAVSLVAGYFPYERFFNPAVPTLDYQLWRASPRMPGLVEAAQHQIRTAIDALPGRPEEKLVYCLRGRAQAPNIRTVTDDFPDVYWVAADGRVFPPHGAAVVAGIPGPVRATAWLCESAGLPADIRARYPGARRVAGNTYYSFWTAP